MTEADFIILGSEDLPSEIIAAPPAGYWKTVFRRFLSNKVSLLALFLMLLIVLLCVFGPVISGYEAESINMKIKNQGPSREHLFGTDQLGRDLFTRVWEGGRVSVAIGLGGALIAVAIGSVYGGIAAYYGGLADMVMMRIVEIVTSVPELLLVIMVTVVLDSKSIPALLFALLITSWCPIARIVRSQMLQIRESEYVLAARQLGVRPLKIITRHLVPNCMGIILVNLTFKIPGLIFSEAFLSYVGLGVQPPGTSWGALASAASASFITYPYQLFFPSLMIALTMLCFILVGDGLRDAMDPKLWRK